MSLTAEAEALETWLHANRSVAALRQLQCTLTHRLPQVTEIRSDAMFILLVEKDAAFMRLAEDRFYNTYPCIILTAKGQPDVATRCGAVLVQNGKAARRTYALTRGLVHELTYCIWAVITCAPAAVHCFVLVSPCCILSDRHSILFC